MGMTQRMISLAPGVEPPPCQLRQLIAKPMTISDLEKAVGDLEHAGYRCAPILSGIGTIEGYRLEESEVS
jgi:hypothetical protein